MNWLSLSSPLERSHILQLENELGITLPEDYRDQIGPIHAGALKNAAVPVPGVGDVPYARNVSLRKGTRAGIRDLVEILNPGPIRLFPFAAVGNGDYFCFDLADQTVVLYRHEYRTTVYVCQTFTQLLCSITEEDLNIQ